MAKVGNSGIYYYARPGYSINGFDKSEIVQVVPTERGGGFAQFYLAEDDDGRIYGIKGFDVAYPAGATFDDVMSGAADGRLGGEWEQILAEYEKLRELEGLKECLAGSTPLVYSLGFIESQDAVKRPAILMEKLDGKTLASVIDSGLLSDDSADLMPYEKLIPIAKSIVDSYKAIHAHGIYHRDASDKNILIDTDDLTIRVIDFNTSVHAGSFQTYGHFATAQFGAPEVFKKGDKGRLAPEQDVWSIGALIYYLRTSQLPHAGLSLKDPDAIYRVKKHPLDLKAGLARAALQKRGNSDWQDADDALSEIVRKCTLKDPSKRPSLKELAMMLETATSHSEKPADLPAPNQDYQDDVLGERDEQLNSSATADKEAKEESELRIDSSIPDTACKTSEAEHFLSLGDSYYYGRDTEKDQVLAVLYYRKAAELGLASAQYNLGYCLKRGIGVSKNVREACEWLSKAADQGIVNAEKELIALETAIGIKSSAQSSIETDTADERHSDGHPLKHEFMSTAAAVASRYRLLERIRESGGTTLYKAYDSVLSKEVMAELLVNRKAVDFRFEARLDEACHRLSEIDNPHVMRILDWGINDDAAYAVCEYVPIDLQAALESKRKIDQYKVARIGYDVCVGLSLIHEKYIAHIGLKPRGIMIDKTGCTKVAGIDLTRLAECSTVVSRRYADLDTDSGRDFVKGMHADIYSLGAIMYAAITGRFLEEVAEPDGIRSYFAPGRMVPPGNLEPSLDSELEFIILKALGMGPTGRYDSAKDMGMDLLRFLKQSSSHANE